MTVKVNGIVRYVVFGTVDYNQNISVEHILFENACRAKMTFIATNQALSSPFSVSLMPFTSTYNLLQQTATEFVIEVLNQGKIKLQISHLLAPSTSLSSIIVNITTFSDRKCLGFCQARQYTNGRSSLGRLGAFICNCVPNFVWNPKVRRC